MTKTIGENFFLDPRLKEAKKLIQEALKEHQKNITGVKAPNPELKESYDQLLKKMADYRGGALFYNYLGTGIGHGPFVELADGSVKYDFITGIGVHYMGHSHPGVIEAQIKIFTCITLNNINKNRIFNLLEKLQSRANFSD
jgi:acetylornithine aminotransferase